MNNGFYYPGDTDPAGAGGGGMGDSGGGIAGAILNVGAGLYDSYQNRKQSKWNTNRTIQAQLEQAELAYQRSLQMWNMQNLYNSPQAQMARFKAAGLNPHLIYGQGNPGNASAPPEYHAPDIQYRYAAAPYGQSFAAILPTLMSVGTWMQNMRLSEAELDQKVTNTRRAEQVMEYLAQANPKLLQQLQNKLDMYPMQQTMLNNLAGKAHTTLADLEQEFRYKWGDSLFSEVGSLGRSAAPGYGVLTKQDGIKKLQFLQEVSKTKLAEAKASWSEFDITDPQAIIQLVLSGVMGMAGMTLRHGMSKGSTKRVVPRERPRGLNRSRMSKYHPDRR